MIGYSAVIIFLYNNPIKIDHFLFDLRVVVLLFLAVTHSWRLTIPTLIITAIWRIMVIGGPVAWESVIINMTFPVLIGLYLSKRKKHILLYKELFLIASGIWLVTQIQLIWIVPNGIEILKSVAVVHYLSFIISLMVLYSFYMIDMKNKEMKEKIHQMAFYDALTGIPNRYMLNESLHDLIMQCKQNSKQLAVLFLDLDGFKYINDSRGHGTGDLLLKGVAERLVTIIKQKGMVTRQGGDEFLVLLQDICHSEVNKIAQRILDSFKEPFIINSEEFFTTPSIGISMYPSNGEEGETLIKNADKAMFIAKSRGKNNVQFYTQEQDEQFNRKAKLEQFLRRAIENKEFFLCYQPKIKLKTGEIYGAEALVRWKHPELGDIAPAEFIPIAEETRMIVPIGKWILKEACNQTKKWKSEGIHIKMAVNVSAIQFEDYGFVEEIKQVLLDNHLAPENLILEITESVMQNIKISYEIIHELKKIGVIVAIDDFGTGYSSLSVLNNLPIDLVKIDKSFVDESLTKANTASLIKTIIKMGEDLNFHLVAEGIETKEQAEFFQQSGCDYGQGYYYSKPLPADEVKILLKNYGWTNLVSHQKQ